MKILTSFFILILSACSGGGGDNTNPSPSPGFGFEGIKTGTIVTKTVYSDGAESTSTSNIHGISYNGKILLFTTDSSGFSTNYLYSGTYTQNNNSISGTLNFYNNSNFVFSSNFSGALNGLVMTGLIGPNRNINLSTNDGLWEKSSSLTTLAGTWSDGFETWSFDQVGNFDGSNTDGCVFSGNVTTPDSSINIYAIKLEISLCGSITGAQTGLGYIYDSFGDPRENSAFLVITANNAIMGAVDFIRQ